MECSESGYIDLSKEWREEERKLIAKGLIKGSMKLTHLVYKAMKKKRGMQKKYVTLSI